MILLDETYAEVKYIEENNLGLITWKGKADSHEYQNAFNTMLDFQKTTPVSRFISDIRNQTIISPSDRKWFETVAMPKAVEQGLKVAAVVFDGNAFKKYYVNVILGATNKFKLPLKVFNNFEEAINWVLTK